MIVPFWAAQNPSLWISHFPEFFFAFSFLGNFLSSGRGHAMGGGYTLSTTILHYNFWKRTDSCFCINVLKKAVLYGQEMNLKYRKLQDNNSVG